MNNIGLLLTITIICSFVNATDFSEGVYSSPKTIFYDTDNQKECFEFGEHNQFQDGVCSAEAEDVVTIKNYSDQYHNVENYYLVSISTLESNNHSCYFQGKGVALNNKIIMKDFSENSKSDNGCTITVSALEDNVLKVTANGESCHYHCSTRSMSLHIESARKH